MEKDKLNNLDKDGAIAIAPAFINFTPTRHTSLHVALDAGICWIIVSMFFADISGISNGNWCSDTGGSRSDSLTLDDG